MITYAGLARLIGVATGELAKTQPPGAPLVRALGRLLTECKALAANDLTPVDAPTIRRAFGLAGRGLWLHPCGNAGLGAPVTDVTPEYCEVCHQTGGWERLYVKLRNTPE